MIIAGRYVLSFCLVINISHQNHLPTCKDDSIFQIHLYDETVYQVRFMKLLGNWPIRKEIDGYPILYNTSLVSLVTINNSELIYMSHRKANSVRRPTVHTHILHKLLQTSYHTRRWLHYYSGGYVTSCYTFTENRFKYFTLKLIRRSFSCSVFSVSHYLFWLIMTITSFYDA